MRSRWCRRPTAREDDDLPARFVVAVQRFAVHPYVRARLLDEPVRLARDEIATLGQPHVKGLPAAAERQQQLVRLFEAHRADGDGSLERGDRLTERFGKRQAFAHLP